MFTPSELVFAIMHCFQHLRSEMHNDKIVYCHRMPFLFIVIKAQCIIQSNPVAVGGLLAFDGYLDAGIMITYYGKVAFSDNML